jgi:hypothetical protein
MALDRLTQITSVGITSGITLTGVTSTTTLSATTILATSTTVGSAVTINSSGIIAGIITATSFSGNVRGNINSSGVSTFTNGPVLIGSGTSTGTASQPLQVTGGAYVSGSVGIGTIIPGIDGLNGGPNLRVSGIGPSIILYDEYSSGRYALLARTGASTELFRIYDVQRGADRLCINSSGNVLINTTSATGTASQPLQVTGGAYVSGSVGIGTTIPTVKLQVSSSGNTPIINQTTGGSTSYLMLQNTGGMGYIASNNNDVIIATSANANERVRIDSSGRVTMPYQPCFQAAGNQATTYSSQVVPFNVSLTNNGSNYSTSTYRFTAPVAGYYFFTFHAILGGDSSGIAVANMRRNGIIVATIHRNTSASYNFSWEQGACSAVLYLAVSDYVDCYIANGTIYCGGNITGGEVYSAFNGHIIG